jgi:nitroimidazol reductase NimA-like FMN-containing flavoprotein (pyridoxamine 5'-phosphate oxidase superfamily)
MRRKDREAAPEQTVNILNNGEYGVLSTVGKDGQPYGIPLSYVYSNNCIYFHCAKEGHKLDNLLAGNRVSFCVVGATQILPEKFSTRYESAIAFGTASEVFGGEKYEALLSLVKKYSPDFVKEGIDYAAKSGDETRVIKIEIEHLSGKASR